MPVTVGLAHTMRIPGITDLVQLLYLALELDIELVIRYFTRYRYHGVRRDLSRSHSMDIYQGGGFINQHHQERLHTNLNPLVQYSGHEVEPCHVLY